MLTYKDILYATTKILSDNFECDVIVENKEGIFENECFYVNVVPINSTSSTKTSNKKQCENPSHSVIAPLHFDYQIISMSLLCRCMNLKRETMRCPLCTASAVKKSAAIAGRAEWQILLIQPGSRRWGKRPRRHRNRRRKQHRPQPCPPC